MRNKNKWLTLGRFISKLSIFGVGALGLVAMDSLAQEAGCAFSRDNYLIAGNSPEDGATTSGCVGSFKADLRNFMRVERSTGPIAQVEIWLSSDLPQGNAGLFGTYTFNIGVEGARFTGRTSNPTGSGIGLNENCIFQPVTRGAVDPVSGDPIREPLSGPVTTASNGQGEGEVLSVAFSGQAVDNFLSASSVTYFVLESEPKMFATLLCPIIDDTYDSAYVFVARSVFSNEVADATIIPGEAGGKTGKFALNAGTSFRYYPLDGSAPFVTPAENLTRTTAVEVFVTNNVGVAATARDFTFEGCGEQPTVPATRLDASTVTAISITFVNSQYDYPCEVGFAVEVPGNIYGGFSQVIGEIPGTGASGEDVRSTVVIYLSLDSGPAVQVVDLDPDLDPLPMYTADAYVRTNSADPLPVTVVYSLDGVVVPNASVSGDTVEFPPRDKQINSDDALRTAITAARGNDNLVQTLTVEVTVGDGASSESWSKTYLVVRKAGVAVNLDSYRTYVNTVITSTEGIVGGLADAGLFLAQSLSTGQALIVDPADPTLAIRDQLYAEVSTLINSPESGFSESTALHITLTEAYTFSGSLDPNAMEARFVIDLRGSNLGVLSTATRLAKQIRDGDSQWRGVVNGDGGSVHYSTGTNTNLGEPECPDANAASDWLETDNGLLPANDEDNIRCIRVTIADDGIYDVDGSDSGLSGFISDPIIGVANSADINTGGGGGDGGSDSTGWIVALAALAGLLFAGSSGLWMIFALLAVLGLSLWRRRSVVVAQHRSEL